MKYNIVEENNDDFILASCNTLELAKKCLKSMIKTDKKLQKYYNWSKLPAYKIIESKEEE